MRLLRLAAALAACAAALRAEDKVVGGPYVVTGGRRPRLRPGKSKNGQL
jgi:hypothetical protein